MSAGRAGLQLDVHNGDMPSTMAEGCPPQQDDEVEGDTMAAGRQP